MPIQLKAPVRTPNLEIDDHDFLFLRTHERPSSIGGKGQVPADAWNSRHDAPCSDVGDVQATAIDDRGYLAARRDAEAIRAFQTGDGIDDTTRFRMYNPHHLLRS